MDLASLTLAQIIDIASRVSVVVVLIYILIGGSKKWWVWGWAYDELVKDRDEWKELALSGSSLAERAVTLAQRGKRS